MSSFFDGKASSSRKKVSMGGVSKKSSRSERLKKARDERRAREKHRVETNAALKIQKVFRSATARNQFNQELRKIFDGRVRDLLKVSNIIKATGKTFFVPIPLLCELLCMFNTFYSTSNASDFARVLPLCSFLISSFQAVDKKYNYGSISHDEKTNVLNHTWIFRTFSFLSNSIQFVCSSKNKTVDMKSLSVVLEIVDIATKPESWGYVSDIFKQDTKDNMDIRKCLGSSCELVLLQLIYAGNNNNSKNTNNNNNNNNENNKTTDKEKEDENQFIKQQNDNNGGGGLLDILMYILNIAKKNNKNNDDENNIEIDKSVLFYQSKLSSTILRAFQSSYRDVVSSSAVSHAFEKIVKSLLPISNLFSAAEKTKNSSIMSKANNNLLRELLIPLTQIPNAWRSCLYVILRWLRNIETNDKTYYQKIPHVFINFMTISQSKHVANILKLDNNEALKIHVKVLSLLIRHLPNQAFVAPEEAEKLRRKPSNNSLSPPRLTRSISDLVVASDDEDEDDDSNEPSIFDQTNTVNNNNNNGTGLLRQYNRPSTSTDIKRILQRYRKKGLYNDNKFYKRMYKHDEFQRVNTHIRNSLNVQHSIMLFDSLLPSLKNILSSSNTNMMKSSTSNVLNGVSVLDLGKLYNTVFEKSGIGSAKPLYTGIGQKILNGLSLQNRCNLMPRFWYALKKTIDVNEFASNGRVVNVSSGSTSNNNNNNNNNNNGNSNNLNTLDEIKVSDVESSLTCFFTIYGHLLLALDDNDFYNRESKNKVTQIGTNVEFINILSNILYRLIWREKPTTIDPSHYSITKTRLILATVNLYNLLYERNCRREFIDVKTWQWKNLPVDTIASLLNSPTLSSQTDGRKFCASMLLHRMPQVMNFDERVTIFATTLGQHVNENFVEPGHGVNVKVRRTNLYEDAYAKLNPLKGDMKGRIQISFVDQFGMDEAGIDGGGLFKEFMTSLCKRAFDPQYGMFKQTESGLLYPNPSSKIVCGDSHLEHFAFLGRILGKALFEGILVEPQFAPFFLNKVLGRTNYVDDLQSYDNKFYQSLLQLKGLENVEDAGLTFNVTTDGSFGNHKVIDLIPNGRDILVTNQNVIQYVHSMAHYKLNVQISQQSKAFLLGFRDLIPAEFIRMFNQNEMQMLIGGSENSFDVVDMAKHTKYATGYHVSQPYIQEFWKTIDSFSNEDRALLLKFWTSCSRPPLQGFKHLYPLLCIQKVPIGNDDERLPTASTCMNLLKLPNYSTSKVMKEKLLLSIRSSKDGGFGLS